MIATEGPAVMVPIVEVGAITIGELVMTEVEERTVIEIAEADMIATGVAILQSGGAATTAIAVALNVAAEATVAAMTKIGMALLAAGPAIASVILTEKEGCLGRPRHH